VGRHWRFHKETIDAWLGNRNKVIKSWIEKLQQYYKVRSLSVRLFKPGPRR
jgi:hypothetical protein